MTWRDSLFAGKGKVYYIPKHAETTEVFANSHF